MPQVWIIIVGFCNARDVATCFASLRQQTFAEWGVIVCENGGPLAFQELLSALGDPASARTPCSSPISTALELPDILEGPCVVLQADHNLGYAGAINASLDYIQAQEWRWVWVLNPDTEPTSGALEALVIKARSGDYGVVGSRLVYRDSMLIQAYGGAWNWLTARGQSLGRSRPVDDPVDEREIERQMDYVLGASMLVSQSFVQAVGPMDDRYFLYCEEVDWCLRRQAFRLGYSHASTIFHTQGTTIGSRGSPKNRSALAVYLDERNRLLIAKRFYGRTYWLTLLATALCLARYPKAGAWANFLVAFQGWWDGHRGRSGRPAGID